MFVRHADVADLEGKPESVHFSIFFQEVIPLLTIPYCSPTVSRLPYALANRSADASRMQKMQDYPRHSRIFFSRTVLEIYQRLP